MLDPKEKFLIEKNNRGFWREVARKGQSKTESDGGTEPDRCHGPGNTHG